MKKSINAGDPRVKRTRQLLQQTMMDLLRERDFANISVQEIVARATVNRTTFYAHFEDKYALMETILLDYFQKDVLDKLPAVTSFSADDLPRLVMAVFDFLAQFETCRPQAGTALPLFEGTVQHGLQAYLRDCFAQQAASGPKLDDAVAVRAALLSWAIWGAGMTWSRQTPRPPLDRVAPAVVALLKNGFVATPAQPMNG